MWSAQIQWNIYATTYQKIALEKYLSASQILISRQKHTSEESSILASYQSMLIFSKQRESCIVWLMFRIYTNGIWSISTHTLCSKMSVTNRINVYTLWPSKHRKVAKFKDKGEKPSGQYSKKIIDQINFLYKYVQLIIFKHFFYSIENFSFSCDNISILSEIEVNLK